jgi:hypothetical protein
MRGRSQASFEFARFDKKALRLKGIRARAQVMAVQMAYLGPKVLAMEWRRE